MPREEPNLTVAGRARVYDLVARKEITGMLTGLKLAAGEGTLLLVGTEEDYRGDCRLMDHAAARR